jgi:hypothetical protein
VEQPEEPDYEDEAVADLWCEEMRAEVLVYLEEEECTHGGVGEWPAWHVAPYVSIWAIAQTQNPDEIGGWVICGDLPTDLIADRAIQTPREALAAIAQRWLDYAASLRDGKPSDDIDLEGVEDPKEVVELLQGRAETLHEWASDDEIWEEAPA